MPEDGRGPAPPPDGTATARAPSFAAPLVAGAAARAVGQAHDVQAADAAPAAADERSRTRRTGRRSITFLLAALRRAALPGRPPPRAGRCWPLPATCAACPGRASSAGRPRRRERALFADVGLAWSPGPVADGVLRWTVYPVPDPGPPPEFVALAQAERDLRDQVRRSASVLTALGVARHRPGVREEIAASLRARPATLWPAGMPAQALRVLQHADEVEAILSAASVDEPGGALSASAATARRDALRPIESAVRVARRAAVAEAVRVLAASPLV